MDTTVNKQSYPVGQAPWETGGSPTSQSTSDDAPKQSFPVGQAPWESSQPEPAKNPTFLEDESKDWKQTMQDRADFKSGKVGLPESLLRTMGDVGRLGFLNPVNHLVTKPIVSGYNKLANATPEIAPGKHLLPTAESASEAAQGLGIPQAAQKFQESHPRLTRNAGSAVDVAGTVAGVTGLINGISALRAPKAEALSDALVRGGAATRENVSGLVDTLGQHGITSLTPDKIKVAANILENAASGTTDPGILQNILDAAHAVDQMSGIPAAASSPGLLSTLSSGIGKVARVGSKVAKTAGLGYGGYRVLGGQPLFGSI